MCAENKYIMMPNRWKERSQSLRIYFLAPSLFLMAPCCYWRRHLLWPNRQNHHSFGAGSLALYDGSAGLSANYLCLPLLYVLRQFSSGGTSAFVVVFLAKDLWRGLSRGGSLRPNLTFSKSSPYIAIISSLRCWCWYWYRLLLSSYASVLATKLWRRSYKGGLVRTIPTEPVLLSSSHL